jgi:hypothetical protein
MEPGVIVVAVAFFGKESVAVGVMDHATFVGGAVAVVVASVA